MVGQMAEGYTPSTDDLRNSWADMRAETIQQGVLAFAEFDRWLAAHDAEVAANTVLGVTHRLESDDPRVGEQFVRFEDEWRTGARS